MLTKTQKIQSILDKIRRERERHAAALSKFSADRAEAGTIRDPAKMAARVRSISARAWEEGSRHREAMASLTRRLTDARTS